MWLRVSSLTTRDGRCRFSIAIPGRPRFVAADEGLDATCRLGEVAMTVSFMMVPPNAGPPLALSMTKKLLNDSLAMSLDQALEAEGMAQTLNFTTADTAEAMMAFLEKRDPTFRGR